MNKKYKKAALFVIVFLFFTFFAENIKTSAFVYAETKKNENDSGLNAGEVIGFDDEGNFIMTTYDKIATSNVTYRTIGWTIKRYNAPITGNESIRIKLTEESDSVKDPKNPAYEYHYFKCDREQIFQKIEECSEQWLHELYKEGGTVYLDAIMTVCENGVPKGNMRVNGTISGEVYTDYAGIANARNWTDPQALHSHFDKCVSFPKIPKMLPGKYEVHYMEMIDTEDTHVVSMNYLNLDEEEVPLLEEEKSFPPAVLGEEQLQYVKTKVIYKKYGEKQEKLYCQETFTADNRNLEYKYVKIFHYYERIQNVDHKTIRYGNDLLADNQIFIQAESKEHPLFDVEKGIPVSEALRIDGTVQKYFFTLAYEHHYGILTIPVEVAVSYTEMSEIDGEIETTENTLSYTYPVQREYSYYTIKKLDFFSAETAEVTNYSFPEKDEYLEDFYVPDVVLKQDTGDHLKIPTAATSYYAGTVWSGESPISDISQLEAVAEAACGEIEVMNDTLVIDGETILAEGPYEKEAQIPMLPEGKRELTIEKEKIKIPVTKKNGEWASKAILYYALHGSEKLYKNKLTDVNPVVVHTPVICTGRASDDKKFNQQEKPTEHHSFILGRNFCVSILTAGIHLDIPGYGEQDYGKYTSYRQVRFPFPVYYGMQYISENNWINLEKEKEEFYLPIGVDEGDYYIKFRTLATNYQSVSGGSNRTQENANLSLENYGATDQIPVTVIGRLYGMELTDVVDRPRWSSVFYREDGVTPSGWTYQIGGKDCNGISKENQSETYLFPILSGSHPYNELAGPVRLGYRVKFRLKTIGNMTGDTDRILLNPIYYYVDEKAENRQQVDLYRKSDLTAITGSIVLKDENRSYQAVSIQNVADQKKQETSVQIWNGEFMLSPDLYLVAHGTDLKSYVNAKGGRISKKDPVFKKGGYLIVQFQICSVKEERLHLNYINPDNSRLGYCNMWNTEGYLYQRTDNHGIQWNFQDGDTLVFDLNKTLYNDYKTVGTH